jgi:hypothetical protein
MHSSMNINEDDESLYIRYTAKVLYGPFDPYKILLVSDSASKEEIRASYMRLSMLYHPDKSVRVGAKEVFQKIQKAYDILSDEDNLVEYHREHMVQSFTELKQQYPIGSRIFAGFLVGLIGTAFMCRKIYDGGKLLVGFPYYLYCYWFSKVSNSIKHTPTPDSLRTVLNDID